MASVKVRNIEIGAGIPKICVPIVGKTQEEILNAAEKIKETSADLVEWRVDWYEDIFNFEKTVETLVLLRGILEDLPILFTCRTANEGGEIFVTAKQYALLNQNAIESGKIDLVDVEMFSDEEAVKEVINLAHKNDIKVIGSNHDFSSTPGKNEVVKRLCAMQELGADIPKIAVMPQNTQDVLTLLSATEEMTREHNDTPVVTMSMGEKGVISRVAGKVFGSAITFGAVGKTSAPGQLGIEELRAVLEILC